MGHDISIRRGEETLECFDVIGEGTYAVGADKQTGLYITYNLSPIIYDASLQTGLDIKSFGAWLNGRKCIEAIEGLEIINTYIKANKEKYLPMQPTNGWGTYDGLVQKLDALIQACKENSDCVIHDWY